MPRFARVAVGVFICAVEALLPMIEIARADPALPPELAAGESARVAAVLDGDTLRLETGEVVRLVGLAAPKPPLEPSSARNDEQLAEQSSAALSELAFDRRVVLAYGGRRNDRYGRRLAQVFRSDGLWLQGEMLARGLARVLSHADNRALVPAMLEREGQARAARHGLWADPRYAVRRPTALRRRLDSFEVIEGRVEAVAQSSGWRYLSFGPDRARSLTALLTPESRRLFVAAGMEPGTLVGKQVRVRGFVRWWKGPVIDVTHPEQIELVGP